MPVLADPDQQLVLRIVPAGEDHYEWAERSAALRANPQALVYVLHHGELRHACRAESATELTFDDSGPVRPGLAFCVSCRRVGIVWPATWLSPEDLRGRIDAALAHFLSWRTAP